MSKKVSSLKVQYSKIYPIFKFFFNSFCIFEIIKQTNKNGVKSEKSP